MGRKNSGCLSLLFPFLDKKETPKTKPGKQEKQMSEDLYRLRDDFLSAAELSFYQVANTLVKDHFVVCPKVALKDLIYVTRMQENYGAHARIDRKHVDFVVCDSVQMMPLFAVELDDKSHFSKKQQERDRFVDMVFAQAELPLIHLPAQFAYDTKELGVVFKQALFRSKNYRLLKNLSTNQPEKPVSPLAKAPFCPKCGEQMVIREARRGNNNGRQFYGCVNYPKCRVVIPVDAE